MRIEFSFPVSLSDAIKRVSEFNNELEIETLSRNPKMADDNVLEDDEDIYLLPQITKGQIMVYLIPKYRLNETDWKQHLSQKTWCNTAMLATFCEIQKRHLKKTKNSRI